MAHDIRILKIIHVDLHVLWKLPEQRWFVGHTLTLSSLEKKFGQIDSKSSLLITLVI